MNSLKISPNNIASLVTNAQSVRAQQRRRSNSARKRVTFQAKPGNAVWINGVRFKPVVTISRWSRSKRKSVGREDPSERKKFERRDARIAREHVGGARSLVLRAARFQYSSARPRERVALCWCARARAWYTSNLLFFSFLLFVIRTGDRRWRRQARREDEEREAVDPL